MMMTDWLTGPVAYYSEILQQIKTIVWTSRKLTNGEIQAKGRDLNKVTQNNV